MIFLYNPDLRKLVTIPTVNGTTDYKYSIVASTLFRKNSCFLEVNGGLGWVRVGVGIVIFESVESRVFTELRTYSYRTRSTVANINNERKWK
jgi:hypothetical protein